MANPIVHFEILGPDAGALQSFYRDLFGWQITADNPMNYGIVEKEEGGIAGGVAGSPDGAARVTVYAQTDDPQAVLDRAEQLGATTVMPVSDVPGGPTIALFSDPQGNVVGVVKT
jgi:predicted enzyme related to lactoylglutathione lyase